MNLSEQQIQSIKILLEIQAKGYNDAINRLHNDFKEMKNDYDSRLNELQKSLEFSQKDNDEMKSEMTHLKAEINKMKAEVNLHKENILQIHSSSKEVEQKIDYIDDKQRKCNVILSGVDENRGENMEQCIKKATDVLRNKLEITDPDINIAYRIGKPYIDGKNRDIMIKFNNMTQKENVLKKRKNLKGQPLYVNEDYCKNTIEIRKSLLPKVKEARQKGMFAYINYRELIVKPARDTNRHLSSNGANSSANTSVQQVVDRFEKSQDDTYRLDVSPLPSPRVLSSPKTPTNAASSTVSLRARNVVKYPK